MNKHLEPAFSKLWQPIEILKLRFWSWCGCVEPITEVCPAMHAKRCANCVAVFALFKVVLVREDLDAFLETAASDRDSEPKG